MNSSTATRWTCLCTCPVYIIIICFLNKIFLNQLFGPFHFPIEVVSGYFLLLQYYIEIPVLNANSVDPDQTPHSATSDLGLHCLPMSLLWDARHKWVNW